LYKIAANAFHTYWYKIIVSMITVEVERAIRHAVRFWLLR